MSTWIECRLFDLARFEALRPDLEALVRGEVRPAVREAARAGLEIALSSAHHVRDSLRKHWEESLRAIAGAAGHFEKRGAVPSVNALLDTVCAVGYEQISFEPAAPRSRNLLVLADGSDGHLYAELTARSPWMDRFFNGLSESTRWWPGDLPGPGTPDRWECLHRDVLVLGRADLEAFSGELERLAADPSWLKELSWDRVDPPRAAAAFARLSDLVARARREPHLTVVVCFNG